MAPSRCDSVQLQVKQKEGTLGLLNTGPTGAALHTFTYTYLDLNSNYFGFLWTVKKCRRNKYYG